MGTLNLFGGATDALFWNVSSVMTAKEIISLDIDMPDWGAQLKKRIGAATTSKMITETWCDRVSQECKNIQTLRQEDLKDMTYSLKISYEFLTYSNLTFSKLFKLRTLKVEEIICINRLTLIVENVLIKKVFYPKVPPDLHIKQFIKWLKIN